MIGLDARRFLGSCRFRHARMATTGKARSVLQFPIPDFVQRTTIFVILGVACAAVMIGFDVFRVESSTDWGTV